jgi:hypothetical protein
MKLTRSLLLVVLMLGAVAYQAEAKKVNLKYQLKAGDEFSMVLSVGQEVTQDMMGQTQTQTVSTSITYHFKVLEALADGNFRLEGAMSEYSMDNNGMMGAMKYNSATDKEVPDFAKATSMQLNEKFLFTLSPIGTISDVKAPEGLAQKIKEVMGNDGEMAAQLSNAVAEQGSADGFAKSISGFFLPFPEAAVAAKKPWTQETQMEQIVSLKTVNEYSLAKASKESNEIGLKSSITMDNAASSMEMQGMTMNFDLSGGKTGTFSLEPGTGLIKSSEAVTSISGVISIESSQLPAPMSIPMTVKSTEKITRK